MRINEIYQPVEENPLQWAKDKMASAKASKAASKGAKATSKEADALYLQLQQIAGQAGIQDPTADELIKIFAKAGQTNAKQVSRAMKAVGGYPIQPGDTTRGENWDVIKQVATKLFQTQALATQTPAKIDPALIDAIKKLSGDQKTALGNILLGKG